METSLKPGFAQIFSCCPKNLSCPKFGRAAAPLAPLPGPYAKYVSCFLPAIMGPEELQGRDTASFLSYCLCRQ